MAKNQLFLKEQIKYSYRAIKDYHVVNDVDQTEPKPYAEGVESVLYAKNWIDTVQWHLEDLIRDPEIDPVEALALKRRIDSSNQDLYRYGWRNLILISVSNIRIPPSCRKPLSIPRARHGLLTDFQYWL